MSISFKEHPFFRDFKHPLIEKLDVLATEEKEKAGGFLFREGASADAFYLITAGQVNLEVHVPGKGEIIIQSLGPGEILGWSWIFPPYKWNYDAHVAADAELVKFNGKALRNLCEEDHELGHVLMRQFSHKMVERLKATRLQLLDLYNTQGAN